MSFFRYLLAAAGRACYNKHMSNPRYRPKFRAPSASPSSTGGRAIDRGRNEQEEGLLEVLEDLELFEELKKDLLPDLRELVKKGEKSDVILERGRALATARLVTLAATNDNPTAALAAIKEVLDRTLGRVADKKQIEHRLAKIDDKELDALLISKITEEDGEE